MKKKKFILVLGTAQLDKNYSFSKKRLGLSSFKKIIQLSTKHMGKNFHFLRLNTFKSQRALQDSVRAFPSKFLINQSTGGYSGKQRRSDSAQRCHKHN